MKINFRNRFWNSFVTKKKINKSDLKLECPLKGRKKYILVKLELITVHFNRKYNMSVYELFSQQRETVKQKLNKNIFLTT